MKGLFIPEITAEMFRNGCLESIEALMAEGKIYDIEYPLEQDQEPKTVENDFNIGYNCGYTDAMRDIAEGGEG